MIDQMVRAAPSLAECIELANGIKADERARRAACEQRLQFVKELRFAHYHWGKIHMDQTLEEYERQLKELLGP